MQGVGLKIFQINHKSWFMFPKFFTRSSLGEYLFHVNHVTYFTNHFTVFVIILTMHPYGFTLFWFLSHKYS